MLASRRLRDEAIRIVYSENRFEITIEWSAEDEALGAGLKVPSIDACAWNRFLHRWDRFRTITSFLGHVRQITLIYELSMGNGCRFGDDEFDQSLGFRFSSNPLEKDRDRKHGEDSISGSHAAGSDASFVWTSTSLRTTWGILRNTDDPRLHADDSDYSRCRAILSRGLEISSHARMASDSIERLDEQNTGRYDFAAMSKSVTKDENIFNNASFVKNTKVASAGNDWPELVSRTKRSRGTASEEAGSHYPRTTVVWE
jgi:hypothetical protein